MKIPKRPAQKNREDIRNQVRLIIAAVRDQKDAALRQFTHKFDEVALDNFAVSSEEKKNAMEQTDPAVFSALKRAKTQLERFHQAQMPGVLEMEASPGVRLWRRFRPIERVGLYIPGGSAPLPSTVLMLGVPAQIAGCPQKVLCTPPRKDGTIDPIILAAAELCGIETIYKLGGAQAVAAMAYGTESVLKVDKIFGPGNQWVTEAKLQVAQDPEGAAFDLPAGPSEVLVIADSTANPIFVAADLLSQAEHGPDSQVILLTISQDLLNEVRRELERQLEKLPRKEIAQAALQNSSLLLVASLEEAISISNQYAPEHLILQVLTPAIWADKIQNAGSVFLGPWTPESVGDYASGTNHVLPTYGFAKSYGGLSVESFLKQITFQECTEKGLQNIGPIVEMLAAAEKLQGHKEAVTLRLNDIQEKEKS